MGVWELERCGEPKSSSPGLSGSHLEIWDAHHLKGETKEIHSLFACLFCIFIIYNNKAVPISFRLEANR